jgi:oxygen-independent coproporphyrinogen-3 oxidase
MSDFGIYLHWPFCLSKCPYCDFNSHVRDGIDQDRWRTALLAEIDHAAEESGDRTVTSIFFGGGTPSLMPPETASAILDRIAKRWRLGPSIEVTLEANPTSVETKRLAAYRTAGVNRVSLGVQALDDAALSFLGRGHTAAEALSAVEAAANLFPRYSFDLIYCRPEQTPAAWRAELSQALARAGDHLALYQLTIEPGTVFHGEARQGTLRMPEEDVAADLYETTQDVMNGAGLPAYEISNHAAPGGECRHNQLYWRYGDYVGIGPGAHGRIARGRQKFATQRIRRPERWLEAVERYGHGLRESAVLSPEDRVVEMVMMGLRTAEGVPADRFEREGGRTMSEFIDPEALADLIEAGWILSDSWGLRATGPGRQRLNSILARILV